jgi:hypothetical protein
MAVQFDYRENPQVPDVHPISPSFYRFLPGGVNN